MGKCSEGKACEEGLRSLGWFNRAGGAEWRHHGGWSSHREWTGTTLPDIRFNF